MAVELNSKSLVIGTSLNALKYALENNCMVIFNTEPALFSFDKLGTGQTEVELWQSLASQLSFRGLNPFADKVTLIRIKDASVEVFCDNRKYVVSCEKILFFDDENIENFPFEKIKIKEYKVCDWFRVTSGTNHDHWLLETKDKFVNKIHFYTKVNLPKYKDCVSESFLELNELEDLDYTATMSRLKTIDVMTKAGILGTKHTKTYRYPIKMQLKERQVFKIKEEIVLNKDKYILDTREYK